MGVFGMMFGDRRIPRGRRSLRKYISPRIVAQKMNSIDGAVKADVVEGAVGRC